MQLIVAARANVNLSILEAFLDLFCWFSQCFYFFLYPENQQSILTLWSKWVSWGLYIRETEYLCTENIGLKDIAQSRRGS